MSERPQADRGRPPWRRVGVLVTVWLAVSAIALVAATALDDPVGAGPRDEARPIIAGPVVEPGQELTGRDDGLPPLALVLERPLSAELLNLPIEARIEELRRIAATSADPRRLVELGAQYQQAGNTTAAREAYRDALRLDRDDLAARVGLQMAAAAEGTAGQTRAARALAGLARSRPTSQILQFNRGWLDIYRRRFDAAIASFGRARDIDPDSPLGTTAAELIDRIEAGRASAEGAGG